MSDEKTQFSEIFDGYVDAPVIYTAEQRRMLMFAAAALKRSISRFMEVVSEPERLVEARIGRPPGATVEEIVALLGTDGLRYGAWQEAASSKGISKSTFERRFCIARGDRLIEKSGQFWVRR